VEDEQKNLRGLLMALAMDFGVRAKNVFASMEALDESDYPGDAGELEAASKVWTTAAGLIWSLLGTEPAHGTDRALVRIGLTDLAKLLTKSEQQASENAMLHDAIEGWRSRVAELEAQLADVGSLKGLQNPVTMFAREHRDVRSPVIEQDILSLYIAGGSSERLTVGRPWIDRAIAECARITHDWTRSDGYEQTRPSDTFLRGQAMVDTQAVISADVFWLLAPVELSEGASTELGIALAASILTRINSGKPRARIIVSGPWARRNLFALLADEIYETHEEAWEAIRERVTPGGTR
jgi:hypothetical protein